MGSTSSKQTQNTNAVTTQTPTVAPFLASPWQGYTDKVNALLGANPASFTTPASGLQTSAFTRAAQGNGSVTPQSVSAQTVTPGMLSGIDLTPYLNPYTQDVIDTSINDLNRARQIAINGNSVNATQQGGANAWLSDRAGVADAETNRGFLDQVASLTANLRNQGYANAQQGAQYDIGNKLTADQFNASNALTAAQVNAANALNADQFNVNSRRADTEQMANLGDQQRQIESQNNPASAQLDLLAAIQSLLAGVPIGAFTSQTGTQNGTTTSTSTPSLLGSLGGLALGAGSLGWNPFGTASVFKPSILPTQALL